MFKRTLFITIFMSQKKIILRPKDNGDEPPDGLNIAGSFKRLGILNAPVVQHGPFVYLLKSLII